MLHLALLGTFAVTLDGEPVTAFELDAARALLAYLVLNPVPHRRESIATIFWEDRSTDSALKQLRLALNKLRAALPRSDDFIRSDARTLQCNNEFIHSDTAQFDALAQELAAHKHRRLRGCDTCLEKMKSAAQLYRGELLAGITLDSQPFEEWLRGERERYHHQALEIFYELAEAAIERAEWGEAEKHARRQLSLEPWREEAHYQLILTHAARQQRSAALAQYRDCVKILERELGAAVTGRTRELAEKIKDEGGSMKDESDVLIRLIPLLGRETEISTLAARLLEPATRLVSIVGMGGIGKTRLAQDVAQQVRYSFEHGVLYVSLADASAQPILETLLDTLAQTLALRRDARPLQTQVLDVLTERDLLLVLDNLEPWLANDGDATRAFISKILTGAPRVVLLVTSRETVSLQAEYKFLLEGLAFPPTETAPRHLRSYPSVELFIERAERIAPPMNWNDDALTHVARLCALVNGSPLALELAASWMNRATLAEIISNLEAGVDALATNFSDVPTRHRSMRAVFDQSWNYLPPPAQILFAQLAIFRGGFTRAAVQHITQEKNSNALLDLLQERSLVTRDAHGRYTMHELVRQFAEEKTRIADRKSQIESDSDASGSVATDDTRYALRDTHSHFYLSLLTTHADTLTHRSADAPLAELRADLENIRLAWQTAIETGEWERIDASLESSVSFFARLSLMPESARMVGEALTRAEAARAAERFTARLHAHYARCLNEIARYPEALDHARSAAEYADQMGDDTLLAVSEFAQGYVFVYTVDYAAARYHFENARAAAERAGDKQKQADAHLLLLQIYYRTGEWERDWETGQRALELYRQVQDVVGQGQALLDLALSQVEQSNPARAHELFLQAEPLIAQSDDLALRATAESRHAILLYELGEYGQAEHNFIRSAMRQRQLGNRRSLASILAHYGTMLYATAQFEQARATLTEAIELSHAIGWRNNETWARLRLAQVCLAMDTPRAAQEILEHVLEITREYKFDDDTAEAYLVLGHAAYALDDLARAQAHYNEACDLMQAVNEESIIVEAWAGLARIALRQGNAPRALEIIARILVELETHHGFALFDPLLVYLTCYQVLRANADARAARILQEAHQMLQTRAATLEDSVTRRGYLENIAAHRELQRAFNAQIDNPDV